MSGNSGKSTKGGQRGPERARQIAAQKLAEQKRKQRLVTWLITGGIALVVVIVAGFVAVSLIVANQPVPPPKGGDATSITVGEAGAKVTVDMYVDFQCPSCQAFEQKNGAALNKLVADKTIKIKYHPVAFLDPQSTGNRYSSRSSSAAACAADLSGTKGFDKYREILFNNQPPEQGTGMTDEKLISLGAQAGVTSPEFAACVKSEKFKGWTKAVTDEAAGPAKVSGTPTIKVNGKVIESATADFKTVTTAIEQAGGGKK